MRKGEGEGKQEGEGEEAEGEGESKQGQDSATTWRKNVMRMSQAEETRMREGRHNSVD